MATKDGYDKEKAEAYDKHRENIIDLMVQSKELNPTKLNLSAFDTALKQCGTGSEVFSHSACNNSL